MSSAQLATQSRALPASGRRLLQRLYQYRVNYLLLLPAVAAVAIFAYRTYPWVLMSFQDFTFKRGLLGSDWVGLLHFEEMFSNPLFYRAVRNTLVINALTFLVGVPAPVVFALLLNELRHRLFKRVTQTITYLPPLPVLGNHRRAVLSTAQRRHRADQPRHTRVGTGAGAVLPRTRAVLADHGERVGLEGGGLDLDHLPGRAVGDQLRALRGRDHRRRQPLAAGVARHGSGADGYRGGDPDPHRRADHPWRRHHPGLRGDLQHAQSAGGDALRHRGRAHLPGRVWCTPVMRTARRWGSPSRCSRWSPWCPPTGWPSGSAARGCSRACTAVPPPSRRSPAPT